MTLNMLSRDEEQRTTLYPSIDDIPQSLDVDDIFQKIQITTATTTSSSMVEAQQIIANTHLPSCSSTTTPRRRNQIRKRRGLKFQPRRSWSSITPTPESLSSTQRRNNNRISNRSTRRRRHQMIANIRSVEKLTPMRHQSEPPKVCNTKRVSEVLRQDISNELYRPGDELVIKRATTLSGYEIGRHQAYRRQSNEVEDNNDNESTMIEVLPGNYMKLRGSAEIWDAVLNDKGLECLCFGCTASLVTVQNADMVMCVSCRTISPVEGGGGGLGLGMKKEDATYEKRRFESSTSS